MNASAARLQFQVGMERAVRYWLVYWQEHSHEPAALTTARDHALRALAWCLDHEHALDAAIDLALAINAHMLHQGLWWEWEALLQRLLLRASAAASPEQRFALRHALGAIYFRQHRLDESLALSHENHRWAVVAGHRRLQADAAINLAEAYLNAGAPERALAHAEEAAALGTALALPWKEADGLIDAARALLALGEGQEAERRLQRAADLAAAANLPVYHAKAQLFLGHLAGRCDCWQQALAHYEAALSLVSSYGDAVGLATVQSAQGWALLHLDRLDEAASLLQDAVRVLRQHGNQPAERVALERLREATARRRAISDVRLPGNENVDKS